MPARHPPAIVVHGGAGAFASDEPEAQPGVESPRIAAVRQAAETAWRILQAGGSALDAVEIAVRVLEDDPWTNAGTGACLTSEGDVELDAAIMDGRTLACGAVAAVKDVQNPVTLARRVMEHSGHVLLVGSGASAFAREIGIPAIDNALLVTPRQRARWQALRDAKGSPLGTGTVGAVARDGRGHLAAATSTGGTAMKRPGRVGDTPLIGCGTYADDRLAAVSATGHGERIIEMTLARHAADLVGQGLGAGEAARRALAEMAERVGGDAGLIVVGPRGDPGFAHGTPVMSRAWSTAAGTIVAET